MPLGAVLGWRRDKKGAFEGVDADLALPVPEVFGSRREELQSGGKSGGKINMIRFGGSDREGK